jgi:hypothetical protein
MAPKYVRPCSSLLTGETKNRVNPKLLFFLQNLRPAHPDERYLHPLLAASHYLQRPPGSAVVYNLDGRAERCMNK